MESPPAAPQPSWAKPLVFKGISGVILLLHVQPGASRTQLKGIHGERLKISIKAPPVDGAANASIIEFLSDTFSIPRSHFHWISGEASRQKNIFIENARTEFIAALILQLLPKQ